jgi:hypothetical protein
MPVQATFTQASEDPDGLTSLVELRIFGPSTEDITAEVFWGIAEPTHVKRFQATSLDEIWSKLRNFSPSADKTIARLYSQAFDVFNEQLSSEGFESFYSS